ncbi:Pyridoxamine 5'-phosphate oxidase [Sphingobium sp. AP50]|uniref:pyridoxamine 5'-phosphate oxidase family protein n=1 Tax=Sphingobium sp. AP50 TaxID=1884369 RepID=UPI0008C12235|nr:pyridoxamine 5'-phosphate oxidase family protein [Sphingobium sp. AP50]SEK06220.1 Pyridoxamine 5'-phosphate oxidase [Sphingobium sp. AP50]
MTTSRDILQSDLAQSGDHRRGEEQAPPKYKDAVRAAFGDRILETMSRLPWAFIGTVSESGWPFTSAARFVTIADEEHRPVTFVIVERGSIAEAHLLANPRVGFEAHLAVGWLERRKARAVQIQALATFVDDESSVEVVRRSFAQKYSADPAYCVDVSDRLVHLTPLSIVNFYAAGRPQWGYVDYTAADG